MPVVDLLGRFATLRLRRTAAAGGFLAIDDDPDGEVVLLPGRELPADARPGDDLRVFVHLDAEERPVATTRVPRLARDEVAFLEVTAVTRVGAFVDWGLGKELLVPFSEQTFPLQVGDREAIGLYLDKSNRLAGTMHVGEVLGPPPRVRLDAELVGEAWRDDPWVGLFVILERRYVGLVPADEPHQVGRGQEVRCRVAEILPDGKLVLSLRRKAYQELASDAEKILAVLARPGAAPVGDHSSPDEIRARFGLSKKAFKRAVGRLLKDRAVTIDARGHVVPVARQRER